MEVLGTCHYPQSAHFYGNSQKKARCPASIYNLRVDLLRTMLQFEEQMFVFLSYGMTECDISVGQFVSLELRGGRERTDVETVEWDGT